MYESPKRRDVIECRRKKATVKRAQSAGSSRRTVVAPADNSKFRARCQSAMSRRTHQRTSSAQQRNRHAAMYGQHQISTYKHTLSRPTPLLHTQSNAIESFLPQVCVPTCCCFHRTPRSPAHTVDRITDTGTREDIHPPRAMGACAHSIR